MSNIHVHQRNPLNKAVELYKRLTIMAEARNFQQVETELLIALMMSSAMLQADDAVGQAAIADRLRTQAAEFIEMKLMVEDKEGDTPEGAA